MTVPTIVLPKHFQGRTLSKVAADVVACSPDGRPANLGKVVFDFSKLTFVHPSGIVFLSNLIWWLHHAGTEVQLGGLNALAAAVAFLDDSLFFQQHCGAKLQEHASPRPTTLPLIQIAHERSHAWLETNLVPWLARQLNISEASVGNLKVCVSELFNNIKDHTQFDIGSLFAQHFPNQKRVTVSLSDFGVGIPHNVGLKVADLRDADAIIHAVREGFTTKSTPRNKGVGLDYLLQTVVGNNGGEVTIYSGDGIVRFVRRRSGGILPVPSYRVGFCPGTTIALTLRTDAIEALPEQSEDLKW
jgi:hypothetical protein